MKKWKRLLAASLILSMLSGNVAYAAPGDVDVTVAETETTMEETQVSTVTETVTSTETITQEVASTVEATVETTETAMPESSVEETESAVETTEASGEDTVETTVEATETTEVTTQEETDTVTETEVTVVETVVETTNVEEEITEVPVEDVGLYSQYLPESLTLYADTWQGFRIDVSTNSPFDVNFEVTDGYDNIEIIALGTAYGYLNMYKYYYYMVKPQGTSSLTANVKGYNGEEKIEIPVYIEEAPEDCVKIEDAGWFNFLWGRGYKETYITEERMESVRAKTTFSINCAHPKFPDEAFAYMENCTSLTIYYSETEENWELDYSKVEKLPLQTLRICNDPYLEELELASFPLLNQLWMENTDIEIKAVEDHSNIKEVILDTNIELTDVSVFEYMPNLEKVTISDCEKLTDISGIANHIALENISFSGFDALTDFSALNNMSALSQLKISNCGNLETFSGIISMPALQQLTISDCSNLTEIFMFANAPALEQFTISSCNALKDFSELADAPALKQLTVSKCNNLSDISALSSVKTLEKVKITDCENLMDVSPLRACPNLTADGAIVFSNIGAAKEDILDLLILTDREASLEVNGTIQVPLNVHLGTTYSDGYGLTFVSENTDVVTIKYNRLTIVGCGVARIKASYDPQMAFYKTFYVYVDDSSGIRGNLGETIAEDKLPEVYASFRNDVGAVIWDKVNNKVVDLEDGKEVVTNVVDYAGRWVYGVEESGVTNPIFWHVDVPMYFAGIGIDTDGKVHTYVRAAEDHYSSKDTEVKADKIWDSITAENIAKIGSGCILTTDGTLYCVTSSNTLLKVDTGVTDFLDYCGYYGIYYLKGNKLYNSVEKNYVIRNDINGFVPGSHMFLIAVSDTKSYSLDPYCSVDHLASGEGYDEITEPTPGVIKQVIEWGITEDYYTLLLYEDGTLYGFLNLNSKKLDENVKVVDNLGYIKEENGKEVRYTFTGEKLSECTGYTSEKVAELPIPYLLGQEGIYNVWNGYSMRVADVAELSETIYQELQGLFAIRTDGSVWKLETPYENDTPVRVYPIEADPVEPEEPVEEATSIAFPSEEILLENRDVQQLSVNILPEGSDTGTITYSIDDHRVATVTASGKLRAVSSGVTTVRAESENGLTASCKVTVDVPVELTGIGLAETELTLTEGDSKKLSVIYRPYDTTEDKTITWTSSDSEKVSVDADGTIHALAGTMGTPVTIIGVSAAHEELTVTCKVSVNKILTEEEIIVPQGISVTNNVTKTLGEIVLPEGWAFKEPETALTEHGEKSFAAIYTKEYYVPVERDIKVLINHITHVTISGNCIFEAKESEIHSLQFLTEGMGDVQDCYSVEWKIKDTSIAVIDGSSKDKTVKVTAKKTGTTKLSVSVTLKDMAGEISETFSAECELTIKPAGMVENVKIILGEDALSHGLMIGEADATIHIPYNQTSETDSTVTFAKKYSFIIDAECYKKGNLINGTAVKWTSSDKKVATVKTSNGVTTVTLTGDGVTILTATAQDEGKSTATVVLSVEDYIPRVENNTLTLNKALADGVLFKLYPAYEKEFTEEILVYEDLKGTLTESTVFKVTKDTGETYGYRLNLKDGVAYDSVKNKTYSKLYLRTNVKGEGTYDIPVKIKVVAKLPTVTIKQTDKVNLFYTDDTGLYTISAKDAKISSVEYISKTTDSMLPQFAGSWNGETGKLTILQQNITEQNYKSVGNKGTIRITFEGYRTEAYGTKTAYEKAVTVSKEYKQPQWVLTTNKITKYAELSDLIKVGFYDKTDKTKTLIPLTIEDISFDKTKLKNTYALEQIKDNQMYIRVTGDKASETLPILITKDNFRGDKKLTLKLLLKGENVLPAYSLSAKNITLNKNYAGTEKAVINLKAGTESDQKITTVKVYLNGSLYETGEVDFTYLEESGEIQVSLQETVSATKYDFQIAPVMSAYDGTTKELAKTKIKVAVINKTPTIKLSGKGTINPVDRANTSVQITPKISNLQGGLQEVSITNEYNTLFDAKVVDGKIVITAKEASEETKLVNRSKYKLELRIVTQSGYVFEKTAFTVIPKQGTVKIKKSVDKITCFKPVKGVKYRAPLKFSVTSPAGAQIEEITLINNTAHFVYDAENEVLYLKNADMLAAKNHKLTFEVTCKGACNNVKATKVTVTVSLKK